MALIGGKHIVSVLRHDGLLVDMVNESIEEDSNTHVTRIRIQHVTRIRIQHVTRIRIQHVTRI